MADGLLSNVLGAIDRKKREVKAGLGLLADNPQEWAAQATARYFPTKEEERQFRMVKEIGGDITQTPYYRKVFDLTQFQGSLKPLSKTQFQVANEVAQKNATEMLGLPPDNTAMDRAKALGFDVNVFHGQSKTPSKSIYENGVYLGNTESELPVFTQVMPSRGGGEGGAFFATNAPEIAKTYAMKSKDRAGATYPLMVRSSDFGEYGFTKQMPEGNISEWLREAEKFNRKLDKTKNKYFSEVVKESKAAGKGGAVIRNVEDAAYDIGITPMSDVYAVSSAPVRSRFAAFDPARVNETDLLAAGIPIGLLGSTQVELPKKQEKKPKK